MHEERNGDIGAEFARNVDELLAGASVDDCNRLSGDYAADLRLAERLAHTRFRPDPAFQASLRERLWARLQTMSSPLTSCGAPWGAQGSSRRLMPVLVGLAVVLMLGAAASALAPQMVAAFARRALVAIPGIGIREVGEGDVVSAGPVSVNLGSVPFTVEALFSDGQQTVVTFRAAGFPGGRQAWSGITTVSLRDDGGLCYSPRYVMTDLTRGVRGTAVFRPLRGKPQSVELVIPHEGSSEWAVRIPLVAPASGVFPPVEFQGASATVHGVTVRSVASSIRPDGTAILLEGEAEGPARVVSLYLPAGEPVDALELRDERGYLYKALRVGEQRFAFINGQPYPDPAPDEPFRQSLSFAPFRQGARQATLEVEALVVQGEDDTVTVSIPLAGLRPFATVALDRVVELGGYDLQLKSATLLQEDDRLVLYVDVEPGPAVDGRYLGYFALSQIDAPAATGPDAGLSMYGFPLAGFGVPVEPGASEVTLELSRPQVIVEGPWRLSFPVEGGQ